jgi:hypothetical protein
MLKLRNSEKKIWLKVTPQEGAQNAIARADCLIEAYRDRCRPRSVPLAHDLYDGYLSRLRGLLPALGTEELKNVAQEAIAIVRQTNGNHMFKIQSIKTKTSLSFKEAKDVFEMTHAFPTVLPS